MALFPPLSLSQENWSGSSIPKQDKQWEETKENWYQNNKRRRDNRKALRTQTVIPQTFRNKTKSCEQ